MTESFSEFLVAQRTRARSLGCHLDAFAADRMQQGYAASTTMQHVRLAADLGCWLAGRKLSLADLDERLAVRFLACRRRRLRTNRTNEGALRALLVSLRAAGIVPPAGASEIKVGSIGSLEYAFRRYLVQERGLHASTCANYVRVVRGLLWRGPGHEAERPKALGSEDVRRFVLRQARAGGPGRMQAMAAGLRTFLRWLHVEGKTEADLAGCVPAVAGWRLTTLPKSIPSEEVECLLRRCNRRIAVGQRDYAILLLLARLGLRGGEVVGMDLDDLDWERGEIVVRGKGGRRDRLPLPRDVGAAIAAYLRRGRPTSSSRRVFLRARAPHRGFANSVAICMIVARALRRARLDPPRRGAHLLRHSLACTMLRRGASLAEIGDVLRHSSPDTTAIYAKVDVATLRALAPAWPADRGAA